ncbi:apolipoprotein C-III [Alligator mississippiensis]|nr:apolipoprotein C-III [Alligator mississippiensis]
MRAPVVLALLAVALLATLAQAQEESEDTDLAKENYMQQVTQKIKDTLASFDMSGLAQQGRQWASEHLDAFQRYLEELKRTFTPSQAG